MEIIPPNTDTKVYTVTEGDPRCPRCDFENETSVFSASPTYFTPINVKTFYKEGEYHVHDNNVREHKWTCTRDHAGIMETIASCPSRKCTEHRGRIRIRTIPTLQHDEGPRERESGLSLLDEVVMERVKAEISSLKEELANEFRREIREQILRELDAMQRLDRKPGHAEGDAHELFVVRVSGGLSLAKKREITGVCGKNSLEMTEPPNSYIVRTNRRLAVQLEQFPWVVSVTPFGVVMVTSRADE